GLSLFPAHADSDFDEDDLLELYGDDETVSISTGTEQSIRLAPSVASVVTEADIRNRGATNLQEALEMVPGLHVSLSNNNLLSSVYSIRGIHTAQNTQILLLIDGIPLRQVFNGGLPIGFTMPVQNIKRIEIIRGPGSAVFGADAFAGVINVISKSPADIGVVETGVRYGSFDKQDYWLQSGGKLGDAWQYSASLEYAKSNGDDDRIVDRDLQTFLDSALGTSASRASGSLDTRYDILNARVAFNSEHWKTSFFTWLQDDAGVGDGVIHALDPNGEQNSDYYLLSLSYQNEFTSDWRYETQLSLSLFDVEAEYSLLPAGTRTLVDSDGNLARGIIPGARLVDFPDGVLGNPGGREQKHTIEFVNYYSGWNKHKLRFSVGFQRQTGEPEETRNFGPDVPGITDPNASSIDGTLTDVSNAPSVFAKDSDRDIWFASLQDEWALANDWRLTAGVRFDDYSDFGSTINPRLALVWATSYNLSSKLLYGRAFRAPAFLELSDTNPILRGDEDIEPETIDTVELAFDYLPTPASSIKLNLFAYQVKDLITFVAPSDASSRAQEAKNAIDQDGYGFEVEYSWILTDDFSLDSNYAWQHSENKKTGNIVADAPRQQFYLAATWNFLPDWSLNTTLNWVGHRSRDKDSNIIDARDDVDDYALVDVAIRRKKLFQNLELALVARNVFDEDAFEPSAGTSTAGIPAAIPDDYRLEGRAVFAEFRYHLSK
ncbi:MAG: TonB-dependent receptor plug domain-containing protein, partial [Pseudomonadales bacterium]